MSTPLRPLNDAERALVEAHVSWALANAVAPFRRRWADDPSELESTALWALMVAAQRFDARPGVAFRTYATHVIHGHVKDARRGIMRDRGFVRAHGTAAPQRRVCTIESWERRDFERLPVPGGQADSDRRILMRQLQRRAVEPRDAAIVADISRGASYQDLSLAHRVNLSRVSQLVQRIVKRAQAQMKAA